MCNDGGAWRRDRGGHSHEDNSPPRTNYSCPHPSPDPIPYPTRNPAFPLPRGSTKEQQRSVRKRVGTVRESLSEATPGRQVDLTLVMMMNGWIEIARIGGVRATEAVPLASTPRVGALLRGDHHLKTRKTKTGRSCHAPPPCPPVGGSVRGETAFKKREPSHHTPMQGLRRPLGEKERKNLPSKHPASVSLDLLTRLAAVLGRMDAAA